MRTSQKYAIIYEISVRRQIICLLHLYIPLYVEREEVYTMGYFPFFMDIKGKKCLIAGGGKIALHKLKKLLPYEPAVKIVAEELSAAFAQFILENDRTKSDICVINRTFAPSDIADVDFVIAACDDRNVNAEIGRLCREAGIPVNVVDSREESSFLFPALVKAGKLDIGISTEGASPEVAASVRSQIASLVPANMEEILLYLNSLRPLAKEYIPDDDRRAAFLKDTARACMDRDAIFDEQETLKRLRAYNSKELDTGTYNGRVVLVGAGCGAYDWITVKGLRAIRCANVVVYDDLIDKRLLEHVSERCELIDVGKRCGKHSMRQEQMNALLIKKAREGGLVVRLKGGDPFVFGRGMEEIEALRMEGIHADYIPGVTSCIAVPAMAGIPVTHREVSRSFHVVTGHTASGSGALGENIDFQALAGLEGTLIFLMGFTRLAQIAEELVRAGKDASTPAAVIHGNFAGRTEAVRGTLADIAERAAAAEISSPAVIVVGKVVEIME